MDYRPGSDEDFAALYETEHLRLARTIYPILGDATEAEDCVQEAFVRAYRDWPRWRPDLPARFWVQRIAMNVALSRRRHLRIAAIKDRLLGQHSESPEDFVEGWELKRCLGRLPPKQAVAVLLYFNYGYNSREIGQIVGISDRAARLRVQAALDHLRTCLGSEPIESDGRK
jgi:RNA polymerase sigma-70 factor (ECF subfamily)